MEREEQAGASPTGNLPFPPCLTCLATLPFTQKDKVWNQGYRKARSFPCALRSLRV